MNNEINHQIVKGDSFYKLAQKYKTSVENIQKANPIMNPNNLIIGQSIKIPTPNKDIYLLNEEMREAWEQHVFWTRLLIISILEGLPDEKETTKRLLRNPEDISKLFEPYFGPETTHLIKNLITDHLLVASNLIHAVKNGQTADAKKLDADWYRNADDIASALSSINPHYKEDEVKKMFYKNLDLTKQEVNYHLNKKYNEEIDTFDEIEQQALMMADYLVEGIYLLFYR